VKRSLLLLKLSDRGCNSLQQLLVREPSSDDLKMLNPVIDLIAPCAHGLTPAFQAGADRATCSKSTAEHMYGTTPCLVPES
jgi:hypothetical protein